MSSRLINDLGGQTSSFRRVTQVSMGAPEHGHGAELVASMAQQIKARAAVPEMGGMSL